MKAERESGRGESIPDGHGDSCQGQSIWGSAVVFVCLWQKGLEALGGVGAGC